MTSVFLSRVLIPCPTRVRNSEIPLSVARGAERPATEASGWIWDVSQGWELCQQGAPGQTDGPALPAGRGQGGMGGAVVCSPAVSLPLFTPAHARLAGECANSTIKSDISIPGPDFMAPNDMQTPAESHPLLGIRADLMQVKDMMQQRGWWTTH